MEDKTLLALNQWRIWGGPKFFQFHAVFRQNHMLAPPRELAPSPRGNPGSATVDRVIYVTPPLNSI